jgi:S1-C subfamily serine protease
VNEFSEVIAINAAIRQDADGIGFAIPINTVRRVAEALSRGEIIARPYLGIEMATLLEGGTSSSPASSMPASKSGDNNANATDNTTKNPPREGALIVKVSDASPAHLAGVRIGDVIIDCNGEAIVDANQVRRIVLEADPGKVLSIVVWRVDTFTLETLDVVVGDASLGRVSTAKSANSNYNNNVHSNNNNNKGKDLVIAPPGMGGIQRRA